MAWIKATSGAVIEVPDDKAAEYVEQGHESFPTEAEARGEAVPAKRKRA